MGKALIIKGADFSAASIKTIIVSQWVPGAMPVDLKGHGNVHPTNSSTFGKIIDSTYLNTSEFLDINAGEKINVKVPVYKMDTTYGICFFDANKNPITTDYYVFETSQKGVYESKLKELTAPPSAKYFRVSWYKDTSTYGEFYGYKL